MTQVPRELTDIDVEHLFVRAADGVLSSQEAEEWAALLARTPSLKDNFAQYQQALALLKQLPREKAPEGLSSLVMRRVRRNRARQRLHSSQQGPLPVVLFVALLAAAAAALVFFLSP